MVQGGAWPSLGVGSNDRTGHYVGPAYINYDKYGYDYGGGVEGGGRGGDRVGDGGGGGGGGGCGGGD